MAVGQFRAPATVRGLVALALASVAVCNITASYAKRHAGHETARPSGSHKKRLCLAPWRVKTATRQTIAPLPPVGEGRKTGLVGRRPFAFCGVVAGGNKIACTITTLCIRLGCSSLCRLHQIYTFQRLYVGLRVCCKDYIAFIVSAFHQLSSLVLRLFLRRLHVVD